MNHTDLINYLIEKHNLESYCEIGVQNPEKNFSLIKAKYKIGVDPDPNAKATFCMGSDDFFKDNKDKFSLFFIDGLHHADQVKRDFENALKNLTNNGFLVLHDTLPHDEKYTTVPRETNIWYGDVYKFAMTLGQYDGIGFVTLNMDCGCTVVWKENKSKQPLLTEKTDWRTYQEIGKVLLNIIEPETFTQ